MIIFDIETTGLNPYYNQIVTIQYRKNNRNKIWKVWEQEEPKILEEFLNFLKTISSDEAILGYNNLKFDIPFIVGRLSVHKKMNGTTHRLLHYKKWIDLYQFLGDDYRSLRYWEEKLSIKRVQTIRGKDIPLLYANKEYQKILDYVKEELKICQQLFEKLIEQYPDFFKGRL